MTVTGNEPDRPVSQRLSGRIRMEKTKIDNLPDIQNQKAAAHFVISFSVRGMNAKPDVECAFLPGLAVLPAGAYARLYRSRLPCADGPGSGAM